MKTLIVYLIFFLIFLLFSWTGKIMAQCAQGDSITITAAVDAADRSEISQVEKWKNIEKQLQHCVLKNTNAHVNVLRLIGGIYYNCNFPVKAIEYLKQAIDIIHHRKVRNKKDLEHLGKAYQVLTYSYELIRESTLQLKAIDSCFSIDRQLNTDYSNTCRVGRYKVESQFNRGDYRHCINTADVVESYIHEKYPDKKDTLSLILELVTYKVQSLMNLDEMDEAWALFNSRIPDFLRMTSQGFDGVMYNLAAIMHQHQGNSLKAAENNMKSFRSHLGKYPKGCAQSMNNLSEVYLDLFKRPDSTLHFASIGLRYADLNDSLSLLMLTAKAYIAKKDPEKSLPIIAKAFGLIGPGFDETSLIGRSVDDYITSKLAVTMISLVTTKGNAYKERYKISGNRQDLVKATLVYQCADHLLTAVKSEQMESDSKLNWQKSAHTLYENAIEACYELKQPTAAFHFFENNRAFLLRESLRYGKVMLEQEKDLQAAYRITLLKLREELSVMPASDPSYNKIQDRINETVIVQEELRKRIMTRSGMHSNPGFKSGFGPLPSFDQKVLKDHQALVEIFEGDSSVYVISYSRKQLVMTKCKKPVYDMLVSEYLKGLSAPPRFTADIVRWQKISATFYQLLFADHEIPEGRIIISPDKKCFPFEALIISMQGDRPKYFIEKCAVSYTYSTRYLEETINDDEKDFSPQFAGFAPVEFSSRSHLTTLSGSDESLDRIGNSFDQKKVFKGQNATRAQFMDGLTKNNIMLLYTHAAVNKSNGEPEIYFRDSILTLNNMVLTNEPTIKIINLAACETALGKSYQGEGIFSFSRAFASYGIPSSVANIWSVNDESTYRINELFYSYLSEGTPADLALQRAKLSIINNAVGETSLPYYWAASILTGKSDIICKTSSYVFGLLSLGFCLFLVGLTWITGVLVSRKLLKK